MWLWARVHADQLTRQFPFHRNRMPALEPFRPLLCRLDLPLLLETFNSWLQAIRAERISLDEKVLRGSQRDGAAPLLVVAALGHGVGLVRGQLVAEGQDTTEAAIARQARIAIEGNLLTMDAGLMTQPVVQQVVAKGGAVRADQGRSAEAGAGDTVLALEQGGL